MLFSDPEEAELVGEKAVRRGDLYLEAALRFFCFREEVDWVGWYSLSSSERGT